jgi:hypothetical protein
MESPAQFWTGTDTSPADLTVKTIGGLLTSLNGLTSDELFAIPATRTASVYVENFTARKNCDVESVQAGCNHDIHSTASPTRFRI